MYHIHYSSIFTLKSIKQKHNNCLISADVAILFVRKIYSPLFLDYLMINLIYDNNKIMTQKLKSFLTEKTTNE
jgi:hypothetical protein